MAGDLRTAKHYTSLLQASLDAAEKRASGKEARYMDAIVRLTRDITKLRDLTHSSADPIGVPVHSIAASALEVQREWEVWRAEGFYQ
jgi:hypothetical protein